MGKPLSAAQIARNRVGGAARNNPERVEDARRDLAAAKLEQYITDVVAAAPPLSAEQRERLALLLTPGGSVEPAPDGQVAHE